MKKEGFFWCFWFCFVVKWLLFCPLFLEFGKRCNMVVFLWFVVVVGNGYETFVWEWKKLFFFLRFFVY